MKYIVPFLIALLGHDDFAIRDGTHKFMIKLHYYVDLSPHLKTKQTDLEVKHRLKDIVSRCPPHLTDKLLTNAWIQSYKKMYIFQRGGKGWYYNFERDDYKSYPIQWKQVDVNVIVITEKNKEKQFTLSKKRLDPDLFLMLGVTHAYVAEELKRQKRPERLPYPKEDK